MSALAVLSVASAPNAARGPGPSDADADAFVTALTEADAGSASPSQPSRPTTSITRNNAIRGEEVAVRREAENTNETVVTPTVQPLPTPPISTPVAEGDAAGSETPTDAQDLIVANAGQNALALDGKNALSDAATSQPVTPAPLKTPEVTAQPTDVAAPVAEDPVAQAAIATSKAATDLALLTASSDSAPAASGLAPPPGAPREIIERALREGSQTEPSPTNDTASETDDAPAQTTGEKSVPVQSPATASTQRPASETTQPIDVAALTATAGGEHADTGTQTASTATAPDAQSVKLQDLTLSTLARATIETTAQLSAQIVRKLEGRYTRFELALTPEGLGRVDVSLDIDADGQLAARLAFDNPAAAIDLRGRADELRRQLEDAGFRVASDGLDFAERDASSGGGFDRGQNQHGNRAFAGASRLAAQADDTVAVPSSWIKLNLTPRGVDMKV